MLHSLDKLEWRVGAGKCSNAEASVHRCFLEAVGSWCSAGIAYYCDFWKDGLILCLSSSLRVYLMVGILKICGIGVFAVRKGLGSLRIGSASFGERPFRATIEQRSSWPACGAGSCRDASRLADRVSE